MDTTDLHTQTSKANEAEYAEKIKMSFLPPALQASEGVSFMEWPFAVCFLHGGGETSKR